jgi:hypothetical protein
LLAARLSTVQYTKLILLYDALQDKTPQLGNVLPMVLLLKVVGALATAAERVN